MERIKNAIAWVRRDPRTALIASVLTLIVAGILVITLWSFVASLKERFDKWRYDTKVEKLDESIKAHEDESKTKDAEADIINEEGDRKYEQFKTNSAETEKLRRSLASRDKTIEELNQRIRDAGNSDGPVAGDRDLCLRANSLGVKCDITKFR